MCLLGSLGRTSARSSTLTDERSHHVVSGEPWGRGRKELTSVRSCKEAGGRDAYTEQNPVPMVDSRGLLWPLGLAFLPASWERRVGWFQMALTCSRRKPVQTRTCHFHPRKHRFPGCSRSFSSGSEQRWHSLDPITDWRGGHIPSWVAPHPSLCWALLGARSMAPGSPEVTP